MRTLVIALSLLVTALPAQAISRYNSMQMSCGEAQSRIQREGAVILRYRSARDPSLPLYDRYVAHGGYCQRGEYAKLEVVPTADTRSCQVLRCMQRTYHPFDE